MKRKLTLVFLLLSALWSPFTQATVYSNFLFSARAPNILQKGDSFESATHALVMQIDGNLVFYRKAGMVPVWSTGTHLTNGSYAIIQGDGNFVVYTSAGQAVWNTGTGGRTGTFLLSLSQGPAGVSVAIIQERAGGGGDWIWQSKSDPIQPQGCSSGSTPQRYPVCIGGMTYNLPMCSQADAANYAHSQGGYYGACH